MGVDYCKASQVSKPRGAPAGLVELADHKIDTALEIWKRCLETDRWPGYSDDIASVEVGWQAQDFVER